MKTPWRLSGLEMRGKEKCAIYVHSRSTVESWISVSIVILGIMMRACVHLI